MHGGEVGINDKYFTIRKKNESIICEFVILNIKQQFGKHEKNSTLPQIGIKLFLFLKFSIRFASFDLYFCRLFRIGFCITTLECRRTNLIPFSV